MREIVIISPKYGKYSVLVDNQDYDMLKKHTWRINKPKGKVQYALTNIKNIPVKMHRMILNNPKGNVDHVDGNGLNNQRMNLRICNHHLNGFNRGLNKNNTLGVKGVRYHKRGNRIKRYSSVIKINRKAISLGYYHTLEAAAIAYNLAAQKYVGEFAYLNKI